MTNVPEQTVPAEAVMLTDTGSIALTIMLMMFEVAGLPVVQAR